MEITYERESIEIVLGPEYSSFSTSVVYKDENCHVNLGKQQRGCVFDLSASHERADILTADFFDFIDVCITSEELLATIKPKSAKDYPKLVLNVLLNEFSKNHDKFYEFFIKVMEMSVQQGVEQGQTQKLKQIREALGL